MKLDALVNIRWVFLLFCYKMDAYWYAVTIQFVLSMIG